MKKHLLKFAAMAVLFMAAMTVGQAQNVPITLNQGWNWISYPRSEPMTIQEALSGFTPANGDIINSQTEGSATYLNGRWRGSLTTLVPGKGYMYNSADGTTRSFVFGGDADDPSALPEEALEGEFTVDANGTKVRFSPGNLQCHIDPDLESQLQVGAGTNTTVYMPYYTWYCYSLCQMIYKASELTAAGLSAGPITGISFESYSTNHYERNNIKVWMMHTSLTTASTTSTSSVGTQVFNGTVTQQTGWTEIPFSSNTFTWNGTSNVLVTVAMNHGSYNSSTNWQCNSPGFTCCNYNYNDDAAYYPNSISYSMNTSNNRPNTRFHGHGGVVWSFAQSQQDFVGADNANISSTYHGLIDLFGWGTSGHPHGAVYYQPWSSGEGSSNYYAYGDESYNLYDQNGEADWGINAISNGGDQPGQWRTLTHEEWVYLFNTRSTPSGIRFAKAKVRGVNGMILLPDNWSTSYYSLNNTNTANTTFDSNIISSSQWQTLEQHGVVFLPTAGDRYVNQYYADQGNYWSSSQGVNDYGDPIVYGVYFGPGSHYSSVNAQQYMTRSSGKSVRLVCESNPRIRVLGVTGVSTTTATVGAELDYTGSATVTERGVCWNYAGAPSVDDSHQSAGSGTGGYSVQMTNLASGTTYHVRAYAKIGNTYRYGHEVSFTTHGQLTVTTATVTDVTLSYALCGGTVSDCGLTVTAHGLCWGTSSYPTLDDSYSYDGRGPGSFRGIMNNLASGTTYYVRAYATTANGTVYGTQRSFTTPSGVIDVSTAVVSNVTASSATSGGTVENNGGADITARGVCWSINAAPTVYEGYNYTVNGSGTGSFTSTITGLAPSTTYHVRAYATTANDTYYGNERVFTTQSGIIEVTTTAVHDITTHSAVSGGTVLNNYGGPAITARGVCWSTSHNPTLYNSHTTNGSGAGSFTSNITGLSLDQTYYVRAYATTANGTIYGQEVSFTPAPWQSLDGIFSVSATQRVHFSKGNLQYDLYFHFAEHQWDIIGEDNSHIGDMGTVCIDLFGWGTSDYNHGANCWWALGYSTNNNDYWAYGDPSYNLYDQDGKADWGWNDMGNSGTQYNTWRTLTKDEWVYVFNTRSTSSGIRYAKAKVNNVNGVILLPDNWSASYYSLSNTNNGEANYSSNVISASQWDSLEQHGAVFLPAAGNRTGTSVYDVGSLGIYWSASYYNSHSAYYVLFSGSYLYTTNGSRCNGKSVRLVCPAQ